MVTTMMLIVTMMIFFFYILERTMFISAGPQKSVPVTLPGDAGDALVTLPAIIGVTRKGITPHAAASRPGRKPLSPSGVKGVVVVPKLRLHGLSLFEPTSSKLL